MTEDASAIYFGTVMHQRLKPRRHGLRYSIYLGLFDLDTISGCAAASRIFSHNRFNLFSFYDRDHGAGSSEPLRAYVERQLAAANIDTDGGPIRLLCSPRVLGYVFNPLSVYFCYRRDGALAAILYEVTNTFRERHSYLIPAGPGAGAEIQQSCDKCFYVSPFIEMAMTYHFAIRPPGEDVSVRIRETDRDGTLLIASFTGKRAPLTDRSLLRAFFAYPLVTLKVVAGIHWEALRLWLKGVKLVEHPPAPLQPVTIVVGHD